MMLIWALRVVGSAHDGRKKSIMQTGQALLCYAVMFIIQCIIPCYAHRPGNIPYHTVLYGMQALAGRNQGTEAGLGGCSLSAGAMGRCLRFFRRNGTWPGSWLLGALRRCWEFLHPHSSPCKGRLPGGLSRGAICSPPTNSLGSSCPTPYKESRQVGQWANSHLCVRFWKTSCIQ